MELDFGHTEHGTHTEHGWTDGRGSRNSYLDDEIHPKNTKNVRNVFQLTKSKDKT